MKTKLSLKHFLVLLFAITLSAHNLLINVSAAGVDDGNLLVTKKDSVTFLGVEETEWRIKFTSADGSGKAFYRYEDIKINEDDKSDIRDLIRLKKNISNNIDFDIDGDGKTGASDLTVLRKVLLGDPDFEIVS